MPSFPGYWHAIAVLVFTLATPAVLVAPTRAPEARAATAVANGAQRVEARAPSMSAGPPTVRLWATRIGLVGRTTANGHVIGERDRFVALPSKRALNRRDATDYAVHVSYRGRAAVAPVWDIGPWNIKDDYWSEQREQFPELPRWVPQAEAAFFAGHNGGRDAQGRFVTMPASIDLADGTFWDDLGMGDSDWVDVTFLWVDAPSPPPRQMRRVTVKSPLPQPAAAPTAPQRRAASYNAPSPASRVFLPLVMHNPAGWTTPWTVQNAGPAPVYGTVDLYDPAGARVGGVGFHLAPFASETFGASDVPGVGAGFVGGAVISATGPIAVVLNEDREGADRMAYEGFTAGSTAVAVPLVLKEYNGWSTGIQVQNLGGVPAMVQVTYIPSSGSQAAQAGVGSAPQPLRPEGATIAPMASATFYQPANPALPAAFVGSAIVQAANGQPLAVLVNQVRADGAAMAYPAIAGGGAERLSVPLLLKRYNGWDTGLQLFNLSPTATLATIAYQGLPQPVSENAVVPGGSSVTLYQPAQALLQDGYSGSAAVLAGPGSRLAGIVNEVRTGERAATNYTVGGSSAGSSVLAVPLVMHDNDDWDTSIHVQNLSDAPTRVVATFYAENGVPVHRIDELLTPAVTRTYAASAMPELPAGFRGSALIHSVSGHPLVGVVNQTTR